MFSTTSANEYEYKYNAQNLQRWVKKTETILGICRVEGNPPTPPITYKVGARVKTHKAWSCNSPIN